MANRLLKWMIAGLMAASVMLTAACSLMQTDASEGGGARNADWSSMRWSPATSAASPIRPLVLPDWIELYNASNSAINLAGYG